MERYIISTGTVTYAAKARQLLRTNGFKASVERRSSGLGSKGCGYVVITEGNIKKAEEILKNGGVKVLEINRAE